jgi:hypothetical protein
LIAARIVPDGASSDTTWADDRLACGEVVQAASAATQAIQTSAPSREAIHALLRRSAEYRRWPAVSFGVLSSIDPCIMSSGPYQW